jgi:TolB-like protein
MLAVGQDVVTAQEGTADSSARIWKSRSGSYATKATFLKFEEGVVQLEKQDGTVVSLPIEKLSDADQEFVKKTAGGGRTTDDAPSTKSGEGGKTSELEIKCQRLCEEITKGYKGNDAGGKATIAVVEFSDLSGAVTVFGRLLSEELITKLFATGKYKVIERLLLNKAIAEHKLQLQGLIDPKSAKELGKILGVDAIVSGTIAELGDSIRVNSRLISTETGEVFSVAAATIVKDDSIKGLLAGTGGKSPESSPTDASGGKGGKLQLPFREDFSTYEEGARTEWGRGAQVRTRADGRKWLVPTGSGQNAVGRDSPHVGYVPYSARRGADKTGRRNSPMVASAGGQTPIGRDVELPVNAYIEFDYDTEAFDMGGTDQEREWPGKVISGISMIDEVGAEYRIEWIIQPDSHQSFAGQTMTLPGGSSIDISCSTSGSKTGTVKIRIMGDKVAIVLAGKELIGNLGDFKRFTRFQVDLYKSRCTSIAFTNFKIGKLQ